MSSFAAQRLAIVCPMANEAGSAERFVKAVLAAVAPYGFRDVTFLAILDQASTDGTLELLRRLASQLPQLRPIYAPDNRSVADAYLRGHREALGTGAECVLEIDAGYSHDPREIPRLLDALARADCVFASRFARGSAYAGGPSLRWIVSRGGTWLTNLLLGTKLTDMTSGFQLFRRAALEAILARGIRSRGPFFQTEMKLHAHAFRLAEVPIRYAPTGQVPRGAAVGDALRTLGILFLERLTGGHAVKPATGTSRPSAPREE